MPLVWTLTRNLKPAAYQSDTHWTAMSGTFEVGRVRRAVFNTGMQARGFEWGTSFAGHANGPCETIDEGKAKVEAAWRKWVAHLGLQGPEPRAGPYIDIVFDGPPLGPGDGGRLVEVVDDQGRSMNPGEWRERPDGRWVLRIGTPPPRSPGATMSTAIRAPGLGGSGHREATGLPCEQRSAPSFGPRIHDSSTAAPRSANRCGAGCLAGSPLILRTLTPMRVTGLRHNYCLNRVDF